MTTFDSRENAFENKFAHDAELQFQVSARRNKLLGVWAAGLMGLTAAETDSSSLPASFPSAYSMPYESRSLIVASVSMSPPLCGYSASPT